MNLAKHGLPVFLALVAGVLSAKPLVQSGCDVVMTDSVQRNTKTITFKLAAFHLKTVQRQGQTFTQFCSEGNVSTSQKGFAELPYFHASVQLNPHAKLRCTIEKEEHDVLSLDHPLLPSRGPITRSMDLSALPYTLSPEAQRCALYPAEVLTTSDTFIYRDVKGQNLYFYPAQYDATSHTLKVTKSLTVSVEEIPDDNPSSFTLLARTQTRPAVEMDAAYGNLFLNYEAADKRWPNELGDVGDLLVIVTPRDKAAIQPYVNWKKEKGFAVEVKEVQKGTHVKEMIKQAYEANPNLLYVQLVGGWADLQGPFIIDSMDKLKAPTDPTLGWITDDCYPELIIGRFSGNNAAEISAQVKKTLAYEKDPGDAWVQQTVGIASSESGEGNEKGDDDESDIEHMSAIRDGRLKPKGYQSVDFHGDHHTNPKALAEVWNKGLSVVNYVGHGYYNAWGTTRFGSQHALALKNGHKMPIVCSVACLVGMYSYKTACLGEAMLKNPNGGAAAGMFSSAIQAWAAPMRGQDYFNDLLVGGHQYQTGKEKGTDTDHGKSTFGSIAANACVLMYAESNKKEDKETIETWVNFGDVTLAVQTPKAPRESQRLSYPDEPPADSPKAEVGKKGEDIEGLDATGKVVKLSDHKGKVILLDVSTTWCFACVQKAPELNEFYEKHKDQGLMCVTVLVDGAKESDVEKWIKDFKITMPVMTDAKGKNGYAKFYVNAAGGFVPTMVVLDRDFTVKFVKAGKLDQAKRAALKCLKQSINPPHGLQ